MEANNPATGVPPAVCKSRVSLTGDLFPRGIPQLWCPLLTHFRAAGVLDEKRIRRHLTHLAPHARGILVPGSTGEGWEMDDGEVMDLLGVVLEAARGAEIPVLIGILKQSAEAMHATLDRMLEWLGKHTSMASPHAAMRAAGSVGFTVCPPTGNELSQLEIEEALAGILERGLPTALYQLPQVTRNEMSPQTVQSLAGRFPNFILFKDTSGRDQVAQSGRDFGGVFLVRGAEGDYARWPRHRNGGGPYAGLLLSTANVFARQYAELFTRLEHGNVEEATAMAMLIEPVVTRMFDRVAGFEAGNPFTNANKALDHVMAFGKAALDRNPPLLYSGIRLPMDFIAEAGDALTEAGLFPKSGYLEAE